MIKTIILKWLGSNLDVLIGFLQDLDASIDKVVDAETKKQSEIIAEQTRLSNDLNQSEAKTQTALSLKSGLKGLTQNV
jgi:hypothetical protein